MSRLANRRAVTVFLRGELDLSRGEEIARRINRALEDSGVNRIQVDLADVTFLDCYGLGELIRAHRRAAERQVDLFVIHPDDPQVRLVLDVTGTLEMFSPPPRRPHDGRHRRIAPPPEVAALRADRAPAPGG